MQFGQFLYPFIHNINGITHISLESSTYSIIAEPPKCTLDVSILLCQLKFLNLPANL